VASGSLAGARQGFFEGALTDGVQAMVPGVSNKIQIILNTFKYIQSLINPNQTFPSSRILK
jgi:hypothetical protein